MTTDSPASILQPTPRQSERNGQSTRQSERNGQSTRQSERNGQSKGRSVQLGGEVVESRPPQTTETTRHRCGESGATCQLAVVQRHVGRHSGKERSLSRLPFPSPLHQPGPTGPSNTLCCSLWARLGRRSTRTPSSLGHERHPAR